MRTGAGHYPLNTPTLRGYLARLVLFGSGPRGEHPTNPPAPNKQQVATGFFVSDAGYLITAHHVIEGLTDIKVVMSPRQVLRARTIKVDEQSDLALLKVDAITPFVYLSHSNGVPAGMDVITMGYPQVSVLGSPRRSPVGSSIVSGGMRDDPPLSVQCRGPERKLGWAPIGPGGMVVGVVRIEARRDQDVRGHQ